MEISTILSGLSLVTSIGLPVAIGFHYNKKFVKYQKSHDKKMGSYSELINLTRPFLGDPGMDFETAKKLTNSFIEKYNNEVLPFASREVIYAVQNFLFNSGTKYANESKQTKALSGIIDAIRADLDLDSLDWKELEFHTINEEQLKQSYPIAK